MKNIILSFFTFFVAVCAGAQLNIYQYHSGTVHLTGRFINYSQGELPANILFVLENNFTRTEENVLVPINSDGSFEGDVRVPHSVEAYLRTASFENISPIDIYLFVGDTIDLTIDVRKNEKTIAPGSIAYWVDTCTSLVMEPYKYSPYGDLTEWYPIARGSKKEVETYCRNTAKVVEQQIKAIEKNKFPLPEGINPIAAEIIKTDAVTTGFDFILNIRSDYDNNATVVEFDSVKGINVARRKPGFEPLDDKWFHKFLKRNEKMLLDNPLISLCSWAGSLVNMVEFGVYSPILFYSNAISIPVKGGTSEDVQNYVFDYLLPVDYSSRFLKEALTYRGDSLFTLTTYYAHAAREIENKTGLSSKNFMMQWVIMRDVFISMNRGEYQSNPDVASCYFAGALPYITNPVLSYYYTQAYREHVKKTESTTIVKNLASDPVVQKIIASYKGNVLFLDFWNMGCAPCRAGIMEQRNFVKDVAGLPVKFLYITEEKYRDVSEKWLSDTLVEGEHIYISSEDWLYLQSHLRFIGIPFTCIVDKDGVLHRNLNYSMVLDFIDK